ncbi:tyrosinase family protein [Dactylosporangium sp. NPDC051541]|uniref:tyrosinase family protein n=1 Tax=Dactylosporangium sp. NPDC051541 TaxID=3363977 RepID=UPI0037B7F70A
MLNPRNFGTASEYAIAVSPWHGQVHYAVGGAMAKVEVSPAAANFWCWHAFVDELYWAWQEATPYQSFRWQTGTALHETDDTFEFEVAADRDVFAVKKSNTGSMTTELHILSAAGGYGCFDRQTRTALHRTPGAQFQFALGRDRDVFAIKRNGTGTHRTELHVLRH